GRDYQRAGEVARLKVTARTSAFSFKGKDARVAQIALELGVEHILEGSVRKAGNRIRVTASSSRRPTDSISGRSGTTANRATSSPYRMNFQAQLRVLSQRSSQSSRNGGNNIPLMLPPTKH